MENIPKKYDIDEFPEGIFPITFERIYLFQWKDPVFIEKYESTKYKTGFSWRKGYYSDFNIRGLNNYPAEISNICGSLVSYLYPLSYIVYNVGNDFPTVFIS